MADLDTRPQASDLAGEPTTEVKPRKRRWPRFIAIILAIGIAFVVYAYAFETTDVDLDEIQSEDRQTQLVRILRALARPELLTYERVDTNLDAQVMMPCPAGGFTPQAPDTSGPYIVTDPTCVEPGAPLDISGANLAANSRGDIFLLTPSGARVRLGDFSTDADGSFRTTINTRERPSDEPQTIRAVTAVQVGSIFNPEQVPTGEVDPETGEEVTVSSPRLSQTSLDTWDKIIETVFLALIATTVGTLIAVPLSFFAARNLMKEISVTTTGLTLAILGGVVGVALGLVLARFARAISETMDDNLGLVVGLLVLPVAIVWAVRWALPAEDLEPPSRQTRALRGLVLLAASVGGIITLYLAAALLGTVGEWLEGRLGPFDFLGIFLVSVGDILALLVVAVATLIIGGVFMFLGSRLGSALRAHLPSGLVRPLNLVFAAAAGATVSVLLAQLVAWLYEITSPQTTIWIPALVGAALGALGAALIYRRESAGIGLTGYYMARTTFNGIRAIEPLVMVIVFVVWVGIGPFAGALALALHTTAALAKLYSEQVESIQTGPIEAIKATGATRLQTIVYAVAPQIVPPYISFTMYRWDINVRMSTIIGFAGGGGIGFLLQQNINLLNYRAAAVQMIAIAIVVATMDYISSRLRERFV